MSPPCGKSSPPTKLPKSGKPRVSLGHSHSLRPTFRQVPKFGSFTVIFKLCPVGLMEDGGQKLSFSKTSLLWFLVRLQDFVREKNSTTVFFANSNTYLLCLSPLFYATAFASSVRPSPCATWIMTKAYSVMPHQRSSSFLFLLHSSIRNSSASFLSSNF